MNSLWGVYLEARTIEARDRLVEHYLPRVLRLVKLLAGRFPACAERSDIESTATLALLESIATWNGEGDAWQHLKRVIRAAVERHRRWVMRLPALADADLFPDHDRSMEEADAEHDDGLLLDTLPEKEREVLRLITREHLDRRAIAARMGLSVRQVHRIQRSARQRIAQVRLRMEGGESPMQG